MQYQTVLGIAAVVAALGAGYVLHSVEDEQEWVIDRLVLSQQAEPAELAYRWTGASGGGVLSVGGVAHEVVGGVSIQNVEQGYLYQDGEVTRYFLLVEKESLCAIVGFVVDGVHHVMNECDDEFDFR